MRTIQYFKSMHKLQITQNSLYSTGFISHILVHLLTYRQLGLIGATLYFVGALSSGFMEDLFQMIICVSAFQGK